jgi:sulfate adenylyltransferase subunit 1 (EFTu-like GTPase family)
MYEWRRGHDYVDLALLTDGLRAEREQGITIDVAYRGFVTPRRRFQLADAPGHVQYTRNMVTGASTADVAVVLVDARKGVIEQTRRHSYITAMLELPHVVYAVNKMDLVDFSEERFDEIARELAALTSQLGVRDATAIPVSALKGDNVVERTDAMPWYAGTTLLEHLETLEIAADRNFEDRRFPVQWVIRPGAGLSSSVAMSTTETISSARAGTVRVVCLISRRARSSSGVSAIHDTRATSSRATIGARSGSASRSPRETSTSSESRIVTDSSGSASSRGSPAISTDATRVRWPEGRTTTSSPARHTPLATCPAYPR